MSVAIRAARPEDVPAINAIYNASVAVSTASWDIDPEPLATRQAWFERRARLGHPVLVAEDDGRVLGWGSWGTFRDKPGYARTMEHTLYVAEDARGRGVGNALLAAIVETARAAGVHVLLGVLSNENDVSLRLHEKLGFREMARLPQVGAKFGRWLDMVLVQLVLDDAPAP